MIPKAEYSRPIYKPFELPQLFTGFITCGQLYTSPCIMRDIFGCRLMEQPKKLPKSEGYFGLGSDRASSALRHENHGVTDHGQGNSQPGGRSERHGDGRGSRALDSGSQRCSCSISAAAAARRGMRTATLADIRQGERGPGGVLLLEQCPYHRSIDADLCRRFWANCHWLS